jgi:hypothetical protein
MARPLIVTGLVLALALAACGGSDTTTVTSQPPNETALHWSRCPSSDYDTSVAGISCRDAQVHRFATPSQTGSAARIRTSAPQTFAEDGFDCTQFPLEDGFGWHIVCARGSQHISWYSTP